MVRKYPKYQGGFIWDWADQGILKRNNERTRNIPAPEIYGYGGDFHKDDASDQNFCNNGVVAPNRELHPHAYEIAQQYQNIWVTANDLQKGEINIYNENFFRNLKNYTLSWEILENGVATQTGIIADLNVEPQKTVKVTLPYSLEGICPCKEIHLNVYFSLKSSDGIRPAGQKVAGNQLAIREKTEKEVAPANCKFARNLQVLNDLALNIMGEGFTLSFDKETGYLNNWVVDGDFVLTPGTALTPNFWRAPTDNDYGAGIQNRLKVWKNPGLKLTALNHEVKDGQVIVTANYDMTAVQAKLTLTYTISNTGAVLVNQKMTATKDAKVAQLFRFGMALQMPARYNDVKYYGRGPVENYNDRKSAAFVGLYEQTVDEQFHGYQRPQETGNKTDLRFYELKDNRHNTLHITSNTLFSASALHYAMSNLDDGEHKRQNHPEYLRKGDTYVCIDLGQMGMGCVNSWGAWPRKEYQLPYGDYDFTFLLKPMK